MQNKNEERAKNMNIGTFRTPKIWHPSTSKDYHITYITLKTLKMYNLIGPNFKSTNSFILNDTSLSCSEGQTIKLL